jgi:putative Holliday junction resolvase
MKYLGIDYGTKKIGLAISDGRGKIAFPKEIIKSDKNTIAKIVEFVLDEKIEKIVVGKSIQMDGADNELQKYIETFIKKLKEKTGLEIVTEDERMSSVAARSHLYGKGNIENEQWTGKENKKKRQHVDAGAAAIILQRYLDKNI